MLTTTSIYLFISTRFPVKSLRTAAVMLMSSVWHGVYSGIINKFILLNKMQYRRFFCLVDLYPTPRPWLKIGGHLTALWPKMWSQMTCMTTIMTFSYPMSGDISNERLWLQYCTFQCFRPFFTFLLICHMTWDKQKSSLWSWRSSEVIVRSNDLQLV